ncbi:glycosyltransferase family 87 protein [Bradyrhizobium sp. CB1650]|uniref:glycosyltransferase family 87 protein n=1 Tax=Bradyrhizobium sp. CB1650 TaxID=3039153 RepID=UPI002434E6A2|nr:glycosyltransferase family 87 protein [Bradyrhizobium sp. CB1650]WGD53639.1 glycosyltransferase family 87 protein [Bradyrhizobium sp. CB1650]
MLTETLERVQFLPSKRATYVRVIVAGLAAMVVFKAFRFFEGGLWAGNQTADFSAFHIVAQHVGRGDLDLTYQFALFAQMQAEASGGATSFMPWTYPPQFDLLLAPLGFLPGWAGYFLFTAATLAAYLITLRAVAANHLAHVLVIAFPAIAITIACGQNGFLTGALIGLVCINAERRPALAGLALGAMVIKPHLAIAVGVYMLLTRRWTAIATAAIVVVASSLVCTIAFGPQIWIAWLGAIKESAGYLEQGRYPLFRMISVYASLHKSGLPPVLAFWGQTAVACLALAAVALAVLRGPSPRFALGVVAIVSVMISPYAYDYDLPIVGIGLALLLPDLSKLASARERGVLYGLILFVNSYGLLQSARLAAEHATAEDLERYFTPAVAGIVLLAVLAMLLRFLLRDTKTAIAALGEEPADLLSGPARVLE